MMRATLRPVLATAAVAALSLTGVALTAAPAAAATIVVDTLGDADPAVGTTLREAIVAANATPADDDIIYFSNTLLNQTILLDPAKGTLLITDELVISGPSYTQLTVSRASGAFDIFSVQMAEADQDFGIGGLTVQGAAASGRGLVVNGPSQPANYSAKDVSIEYAAFRGLNSTGIGGGAAIVGITGNLSVAGSVFTGNQGDDGGAIGVVGAGGTVTVVDSEFGSNTSASSASPTASPWRTPRSTATSRRRAAGPSRSMEVPSSP
jgi:CSLREA domain-containing protein